MAHGLLPRNGKRGGGQRCVPPLGTLGLAAGPPTARRLPNTRRIVMRKAWVIVMLALCTAGAVPAVFAEEGDTDKKFQVTGDIRMRWERLENYFDFQDAKSDIPGSDDAFSFFPYRFRVG